MVGGSAIYISVTMTTHLFVCCLSTFRSAWVKSATCNSFLLFPQGKSLGHQWHQVYMVSGHLAPPTGCSRVLGPGERVRQKMECRKRNNHRICRELERYVGWGCILNCFMLSSLPCFYAFCWSAIPTSCHIFNVFYSCIRWSIER